MITQNRKTEDNECIAWNESMAFHTYSFSRSHLLDMYYIIGSICHRCQWHGIWNVTFSLSLNHTIICFTLVEFNDKTPEVLIDWKKNFLSNDLMFHWNKNYYYLPSIDSESRIQFLVFAIRKICSNRNEANYYYYPTNEMSNFFFFFFWIGNDCLFRCQNEKGALDILNCLFCCQCTLYC